jgi:Ni,Fe-hydrogenase maturation factor
MKEPMGERNMKVFIAGNKLLKQDSLPLRIFPLLKKEFPEISFEELDPSENLPSDDLVIIDTVMGIKGVKVFSDLDSFSSNIIYSPHDYDFLFELKLNKKLGKLKKIKIIGVSPDLNAEEAFEKIKNEIKRIM